MNPLRRRLLTSSLRSRLLVAASLVLLAFFLVTGLALDRVFRDTALRTQQDKLEGLVYALLAAARPTEIGDLTIATAEVPDPRLKQPASGLQALLYDEAGTVIWSSTVFMDMPAPAPVGVGEWRFEQLRQPAAFSLAFGLRWIDLADDPQRYTVVVLEDAAAYQGQLGAYRRALWGWLGGAALGLMAVQLMVLHWGLSPLRRLTRELRAVEAGGQPEIGGQYPEELVPLTEGLNAMIRNERTQQTRYRHALGDLAHSLKTPLAVIQGLTEERSLAASLQQTLREQVGLMQQITGYQLRKAATAGRRVLSEPVAPRPILDKLVAALSKVYAPQPPRFELEVPATLRVRADAGDLYELFGNLLENAAKYGGGRIRLSLVREGRWVQLSVEDDGPGFPEQPEELLERGVRADTQKPGQGIGLSAVNELVKAYEGRIELGRSGLGGARVSVALQA